ncbi:MULTISPECIES: phosphatase domain-containing protein [Salinicola]|uniref:App1 family protein n=1 Tax=Salinicola TaxID=404432 RepID=UPI001E627003|nr:MULTISPECIES: phosphatase domain-containing protein [Salinicola]
MTHFPSSSRRLPRLFIGKLAHFAKKLVRLFTRPVRRDSGRGGVVVHPFRGYGSQREAFIMGRVFRQPGRLLAWQEGGMMQDVVDIARRVVRRGIAEARVDIRLGATHASVTTDRDGYFYAHIEITHTLPADAIWHTAKLQVISEEDAISTETEVYIPPASTDLIVISDIDDTVMYTGVANKLKMLYRLFVETADRRTAFPGVAALYRALYGGVEGNRKRPMLYVSRGPWSIYEMLEAFFNMNRIPVGPILFLREWGMTLKRPWPRKAEEHKSDVIRNMLALYEDLPFVLIGDSGQRDPEVYTEIVKAHPDRVRAIYIRKVDDDPARDAAIAALAEELRQAGCELVLARDSVSMAEHARDKGLISEEGCEAVRADTRAQQQRE